MQSLPGSFFSVLVPRHTSLPWLLTQTDTELKLRGTRSPPVTHTQPRGRGPQGCPPTGHADALELPNLVQAGGIVLAGVGEALVDVDLAARARVALQTLALEGPLGVDAFPRVLARVGSCNTQAQLIGHDPGRTDALPSCSSATRTSSAPALTQRALVHVLVAGWPHVPRRTRADGFAVDRVGVAVGALVAGVANAGVIEVAQQTWVAKGGCTSRAMGA